MKKNKIILLILSLCIFQYSNAQFEKIPSYASSVIYWDLSKGTEPSKSFNEAISSVVDSNEDYSVKRNLLYKIFIKPTNKFIDFQGKIYAYEYKDSFNTSVLAIPLVKDQVANIVIQLKEISETYKFQLGYDRNTTYEMVNVSKNKPYFFVYETMDKNPKLCITIDGTYIYFIEKYMNYRYTSEYSGDIEAPYDTYGVDTVKGDFKDNRSNPLNLDPETTFKIRYWKSHTPQPRYVAISEKLIYDKLEKDTVQLADSSLVQYLEKDRIPEAELNKIPGFENAYIKYQDSLNKAIKAELLKKQAEEKRKVAEQLKKVETQWTRFADQAIATKKQKILSKKDFVQKINAGSECMLYFNENDEVFDILGDALNYRPFDDRDVSLNLDSIYKSLPIGKLLGDNSIYYSLNRNQHELQARIEPIIGTNLYKNAFVPLTKNAAEKALVHLKPEDQQIVSILHLNLPKIMQQYRVFADSLIATQKVLYTSKNKRREKTKLAVASAMAGIDIALTILSSSDLGQGLEGTVAHSITGARDYGYEYKSYYYDDEGNYRDTTYKREILIPTQVIVLPLKNKESMNNILYPILHYGLLTPINDNTYAFNFSSLSNNVFFLQVKENALVLSNDSTYIGINKTFIPDPNVLANINSTSAVYMQYSSKDIEKIFNEFNAISPQPEFNAKDKLSGISMLNMYLIDGQALQITAKDADKFTPAQIYQTVARKLFKY